jgi:hypothetical protein
MPPNSNTSQNPMPPASPGPNRSMPPHMGPPTPYPGYPPGLIFCHISCCLESATNSFPLCDGFLRRSQHEPVRTATTTTKLGTGQYDAWRTSR